VLGEQHPDTLVSLNNLALLRLEQRRYSEAEDLFNKVLEVRRRVLGSNHPDTISILDSLGHLQLAEQRYADAELHLREALANQEKTSPDTWERFDTESMLGASLAGQGRLSDAERLLLSGYKGLASRESSVPAPNRPVLVQALDRIVQLYQDWMKPEKMAEWQERLLRLATVEKH
jgi:Flp pilus assembly protein TadD